MIVKRPNIDMPKVSIDTEKIQEKTPLTSVLFHEGTISTLYGLPGSGKTNLMVFFSECASKRDMNVWTVIHFFKLNRLDLAMEEGFLPPNVNYIKKPKNIHVVRTASELLLGLLENRHNATILDETGLFASTRAPMAKRVRYILALSYIIRHLNSSFVYVAQTEKSIPDEMSESLTSYEMNIKKIREKVHMLTIKKRKEVVDRYGREYINFVPIDRISRVPLTKLPWDGKYIPKFKFDIDLDETWDRLGDLEDSLEIREKGPQIIHDLVEEFKEKEESEKKSGRVKRKEAGETALELYKEYSESGVYDSRREIFSRIAKDLGYSYGWVYQKLRYEDPE